MSERTYRYAFVTAEGRSCCKADNIEALCQHCKEAARAVEQRQAPDSYAAGLKALRAAAEAKPETPLSKFEAEYRYYAAEGYAAEHYLADKRARERAELRAAEAVDTAKYAPPNLYAIALQREKDQRR